MPGPRSSQQGGMQSSHKGVWGSAPAALQLSHFLSHKNSDTFVLTDNNLIHCICFRKQPVPSHVHSIVYIRKFSLGKYPPPQNYPRAMTGAMCTCLYDNG